MTKKIKQPNATSLLILGGVLWAAFRKKVGAGNGATNGSSASILIEPTGALPMQQRHRRRARLGQGAYTLLSGTEYRIRVNVTNRTVSGSTSINAELTTRYALTVDSTALFPMVTRTEMFTALETKQYSTVFTPSAAVEGYSGFATASVSAPTGYVLADLSVPVSVGGIDYAADVDVSVPPTGEAIEGLPVSVTQYLLLIDAGTTRIELDTIRNGGLLPSGAAITGFEPDYSNGLLTYQNYVLIYDYYASKWYAL